MGTGIRWTPEQLAAFNRKKAEYAGLDIDAVHKREPVAQKESKLERRLAQQLEESDLPRHSRNYFFLPNRDLELDFAFPAQRVAVEVQGMAHRIKGKWQRDIEKRALALLAGWRVLEVDGSAVRDGRAMRWLRELLGAPPGLANPEGLP